MFYRNYNITGFLFRVFLTLIVISSPAVQAVQQSTVPVHGRAPTTILSVNTIQPRVGDVITVTSVFNDADGDAEQGTTYQWTLDGTAISGANSPSYTLSINDIQAGSELNVTVTPQTDPNITLPSVGLPVQLDHPINIQWQRTISRLVWAESPLGVVADGQAVNTVHATVQYLDGTPAVGATVLFEADNSGSILSSAQSGNDGVATAYVTNVVAGTSRVTARIDDDIEFINTRFVAGPVDVVQAEVTQDNALANGLGHNMIMVRVKDRHGNNIEGETVSFTATNGASALSPETQTNVNGEAEITLTNTKSGVTTVTVVVNGISQRVDVTFVADSDSLDTMKSVLIASPTTVVADGAMESSITLTLQDVNGNAVVGQHVTFNSSLTNSHTGKVIDNNDGSYTTILTGTTAGSTTVTSLIGDMVFGVPPVTVILTARPEPMPISTKILVNDTVFDVTSDFPQTGFMGAKFQFQMNGDVSNNAQYSWRTDQLWVNVDSHGNVTFTGKAESSSKTVTITATQKSNGNTYVYTFTLQKWFIGSGSAMTAPEADAWCANQSGAYSIPSYTIMTKGGNVRAIGSLWSEWGHMDAFGETWDIYGYWAAEANGANRYIVNLFNGYTDILVPTANKYAGCSREF